MDRVARVAWGVIAWNIATILLGAVVRATHSGAGCGPSWPTCRGELVPALQGATAIEFTHRVASGLSLALVTMLVVLVFKSRPSAHPARRSALWAAGAVIGEALIGAAIVLYEWVGRDDSLARVVSVPLHLVNTLLLLAALTLTAWFLSGGERLGGNRPSRPWLAVGAAALILIFATGAVTALADTLFPAAGVSTEDAQHFLTRLRVLHPILAIAVVTVAGIGGRARGWTAWPQVRWLALFTVTQIGLGLLNIVLGTPLWLQILHLAVADLIWITYVWVAAQTLANDSASSAAEVTGARQTKPLHR